MNVGHIQNGTNAGWRIVHPEREAWVCPECERENAKHLVQCLNCGTRFDVK